MKDSQNFQAKADGFLFKTVQIKYNPQPKSQLGITLI